jgi:hypothetical protein
MKIHLICQIPLHNWKFCAVNIYKNHRPHIPSSLIIFLLYFNDNSKWCVPQQNQSPFEKSTVMCILGTTHQQIPQKIKFRRYRLFYTMDTTLPRPESLSLSVKGHNLFFCT